MNYEKEYKEFSKWWEELTAKNPNWKTLERLAAKDAWMEATKRAEVNGDETSHDKALHKHIVSVNEGSDFLSVGVAVCPHFDKCINNGKNEYCDLQTFQEIDCFIGQTER
ncbi:MAG: hypothetical protein JXB49_05270 [Bacteroidales bacterium]|nr:hypothetical protein [Bacteroidales bacterium]